MVTVWLIILLLLKKHLCDLINVEENVTSTHMRLVGNFVCQPVKTSSNILNAETVKKIKWSNSVTPIYVENVILLLETEDINEYSPEDLNSHLDVNGAKY